MKRRITLLLFLIFLSGFFQSVTAQIRGVLLKSSGKPLPYTELELVPVLSNKIINDSRLIAISASNGRFSFSNVPPGRYTLSINFDDKPTDLSPYPTYFYPNASAREDAEIFEIGGAAKPSSITFKLPPALVRGKITGTVVDRLGQPVERAWLALRDVAFDRGAILFGSVKTDKNGNFTIDAFADREYQVAAIMLLTQELTVFDKPEIIGAAESDVFTLKAAPAVLKLVLRQSAEYDRLRDKYIGQIVLPQMQNTTD